MEARDERRIRPLPPEIPEGVPPDGPHDDERWRWVPLALVAGAIVVIGIVGSMISSQSTPNTNTRARFDNLAPATTTTVLSLSAAPESTTTSTTTTTTTLATLTDLAPEALQLRAVVHTGSGGKTFSWDPDSTAPTEALTTLRPDTVAYNSDGSLLAYVSFVRSTGSLHVGTERFQPAQDVQVNSVVWHDAAPLALAWVAADPLEDATYLWTGQWNPETQFVTNLQPIMAVEAFTRVVGYGDWGFLTTTIDPADAYAVEAPLDIPTETGTPFVKLPLGITTRYDATGEPMVSTPGIVLDTAPGGRALLWSTAEPYARASEVETNHELGFRGEFTEPQPSGLYLAEEDLSAVANQPMLMTGAKYALAPDGKRVAGVSGSASVTTQTASRPGTRNIKLSHPARLVDFSADGVFIILHDETNGTVLLINWRTSATSRVDLATHGTMVAADYRSWSSAF